MQQKQQKKKKTDSTSTASTKQADTKSPKKKNAAKTGAQSTSGKKKPLLALPPSKKKDRKQLAAPAKGKTRKRLAAPAKDASSKQLDASATNTAKKEAKDASAKATKAPKTTKSVKKPKTTKQAKQAAKKSNNDLAQKIKATGAKKADTAKAKKAPASPSPTTKKQGTGAHAPTPEATGIAGIKNRVFAAKDWLVKNARTPKVIAIAAVLIVYIVGALVFSSHFLPGTTLNGEDVSWKSVASTLTKANGTDGNGYALHVSGDGVDLTLTAADIDFAFDEQTYRQNVSAHTAGFLWPVSLLMPRDFETSEGVSFDQSKVEAAVNAAVEEVNKNAMQPKNATVAYDSTKGSFAAVKEEAGTAVDPAATLETVSNAIKALHHSIELGEKEYVHPTTYADDPAMDEAVKKANALASSEISLTVQGKEAAVANSELIRSWLTVDDSYNVVGNLDAVTYWTRGELSDEVDTMATARTYTRTSDGKRIEVYGGGTYGWSSDGAQLAEMICENLAKGSTETIEIPMKSKAEVYVHGKQDWGPRYVDVDLTEQYVRMFDEDSKIVMESECVSGNLAENNDTVTGVFALEDKQSPMTLIGNDDNGDGEPDYENEVEYWMPFFGGYGLHDALWRSYFGEDVYQYDGSHGCINLPYYAAETLYNEIKVGDVVVVHF